ncbi:hypothetical protein HYQ44_017119 [Verticillium longisporum]|nr:hypothetical protein HYQ44_017119 [Verticillium longisporum]
MLQVTDRLLDGLKSRGLIRFSHWLVMYSILFFLTLTRLPLSDTSVALPWPSLTFSTTLATATWFIAS